MAGAERSNRSAISPDDKAPPASMATMRWRVGSAKADKEAMGEEACCMVMANYFRFYLIKSRQK
jgi:hypothetical protein